MLDIKKFKAAIVSIGDELLIGQVTDTNASWLSGFLTRLGFVVTYRYTTGDKRDHMERVLTLAAEDAQLIVITGGLGPTRDDLTKPVLASRFNSPLKLHQPALDHIRRLFENRNIPVVAENEAQAMLPERCLPLPNKEGTAYGMLFQEEDKVYVSLPGVPYEMQQICQDHLEPWLKQKFGNLRPLLQHTLVTAGVAESVLAGMLSSFEDENKDTYTLAYLPAPGMVRLRLGTIKSSEQQFRERLEELKRVLGDHLIADEDKSIEDAAGDILRKAKISVATAESCTGGYIGHLLTSVPGSSDYFRGGIIAYDNQIKQQQLGVPAETLSEYGAVSEATVRAMLTGVCKKLNTVAGIAVSGIAGPTGGSIDKPVGTVWIGVKVGEQEKIKQYNFGHERSRVIRRTAVHALLLLIRMIKTRQSH